MYAGVSNNFLLCMGGANFPEKMPWEGGVKQWHNKIFILEEGAKSWIISKSDSQQNALMELVLPTKMISLLLVVAMVNKITQLYMPFHITKGK